MIIAINSNIKMKILFLFKMDGELSCFYESIEDETALSNFGSADS